MLGRVLRRAPLAAIRLPMRTLSSQTHIKEFTLADIGEGIAEVELLQWFVKEGDNIKVFCHIRAPTV